MKTWIRVLQGFLVFIVHSSMAQVALETVYVSKKKAPKTEVVGRYYYYPNLESYFDTCSSEFIFKKNGEWIRSQAMPANYRGYSLYNNFFVLLPGFEEEEPYRNINNDKKKYPANFSGKRKKDMALVQK